jgi:two-component system, response regulator PdtaR
VLIAEDDFFVSQLTRRVVERIGYEVVGMAINGLEAVSMVAQLRPDAVLMDIQMPKLDGLEATRQILAASPVPVVIMTAHESQDIVEEASRAGVGAYLIKPPQALEIERAVSIAIARFADLMEIRRLHDELAARNEALEQALADVKTLKRLLPICSFCKKVRDDDGYWSDVDSYLRNHSEILFSHGVCPDCLTEHYPDYSRDCDPA